MRHLQAKLFRRALEIAGDSRKLASQLAVSNHQLEMWANNLAPAPSFVIDKLLDLIIDDDIARAAQDRRGRPRGAGGTGDANPSQQ